MKDKILYVDFSHLARRAFHLVEESKGIENGTTFSVLRMLKRVKTSYPDHIIVCVFDGKKSTGVIRKHLFSQYKEHRFSIKGASSVLLSSSFYPQLDYLYHTLRYLGIWCMKSEIFEADVVIASQVCGYPVDKISFFAGDSLDDVVLSGDQDYIPMVREGVSWLRPTSRSGVNNLLIKYSPNSIFREFGVYPKWWPFVKLLLGDSSDGVPGVPGYGKVKSLKKIKYLRDKYSPDKKHEFLKILSEDLNVPLSVLFPKFLLFDMSAPNLLVSYVISRLSEDTRSSEMLEVFSPESSRSFFRNMCRRFKFQSILEDMSGWVSVFDL